MRRGSAASIPEACAPTPSAGAAVGSRTATAGGLGVSTYSWGAADPTAPAGAQNATATNHATLTSASGAFALTSDVAPPATGSVTYADGYRTATSVSVSFTAGTDGGAGLGATSRLLQRGESTFSPGTGTRGDIVSFATLAAGTSRGHDCRLDGGHRDRRRGRDRRHDEDEPHRAARRDGHAHGPVAGCRRQAVDHPGHAEHDHQGRRRGAPYRRLQRRIAGVGPNISGSSECGATVTATKASNGATFGQTISSGSAYEFSVDGLRSSAASATASGPPTLPETSAPRSHQGSWLRRRSAGVPQPETERPAVLGS